MIRRRKVAIHKVIEMSEPTLALERVVVLMVVVVDVVVIVQGLQVVAAVGFVQ